MKVKYGSLNRAQPAIQRLLSQEPEAMADKFALLKLERSLVAELEAWAQIRDDALCEHGQPHPHKRGVYIFPQLDENGEPLPDPDYKDDDPDGAKFLVDEDRLQAFVDAMAEAADVEFDYEPLVDLAFLDRVLPDCTQLELALLWFVFKEGREIAPVFPEGQERGD